MTGLIRQATQKVFLEIDKTREAIRTMPSRINKARKVVYDVRAVINIEENGNLANYLTFARIYAIPVIIFLIIEEITVAAGILFFAASLTDFLDGYIAKNHGHKTKFGEWLDPIADKLLVLTVLPCLGLSLWIVLPIFFREIVIMLGRLLISGKKIENQLQVRMHGRIKAVLQCFGVGYTIFTWPFFSLIMFLVMLYTLWSGYIYYRECRPALE